MANYSERDIQSAIFKASEKLGYAELCAKQEAAVKSFLKGQHVFVCLPTGSGKSLCYCLLPEAFDRLRRCQELRAQSVVVVVSPLIALMKDQVRAMTERNVTAVRWGQVPTSVHEP